MSSEFRSWIDLGVSLFCAARAGRQSRCQTLPWRRDRARGSRRPSTDWFPGDIVGRLEIDGLGKTGGMGRRNLAFHSDIINLPLTPSQSRFGRSRSGTSA